MAVTTWWDGEKKQDPSDKLVSDHGWLQFWIDPEITWKPEKGLRSQERGGAVEGKTTATCLPWCFKQFSGISRKRTFGPGYPEIKIRGEPEIIFFTCGPNSYIFSHLVLIFSCGLPNPSSASIHYQWLPVLYPASLGSAAVPLHFRHDECNTLGLPLHHWG